MWFVFIALATIVSSLITGRLLAKAAAEQTSPRPVRGPSLQNDFQTDRLAIAAQASRRRQQAQPVHLN